MIFEPSWTLHIGDQRNSGTGLLHKTLWTLVDYFDLFSATLNGAQIIVLPKEGKITKNFQTLWVGERGKLIWSRRMKITFSQGSDVKTECYCYRVGLEGSERNGFHIFSDGRIEKGLG